MKVLASFVMRGQAQAVLVTTVLAMLAPFFLFVGLFSSACVALVTLRQGWSAGLKTLLLSTLASGLLMGILVGTPMPALGLLLILWLPMVLLGALLRNTRSLDLTVQAGIGFGLVTILVQYLSMGGEPAEFWKTILEPMGQRFIESGLIDAAQSSEVIAILSNMMCGMMAVTVVLQTVFSLFVARWWQAMLYNPGGFGEEFRRFRLHPGVGVLGAAALALGLLPEGSVPDFVSCLGMVFLGILFVQGLAVMHGVFKPMRSAQLWLVLAYLTLIVFMPQMVLLLIGLGLADIWADFRARFESSKQG
ncbi:MAG: DUF2232 domain-containing protein [Candidatus Thiodiazotropha sp.]|jgi:hypothetical protein